MEDRPSENKNGVDYFYAEVGKRIRQARSPGKTGKQRISQVELAKAASLTRTSVANIESGRQRVLLHTLVAFAEALGVDPSSLIPPISRASELPSDLEPNQKQFVESILKIAPKRR